MEKVVLQKTILIGASPERIWEILVLDAYTRVWLAEFREGSFAESNWEPGSNILFEDGNGTGIIGFIREMIPGRVLTFEYTGLLNAGREDLTSAEALAVRNTRESYRLTAEGDATRLTIAMDLPDEYFSLFNSLWDNALTKIKALAED